MRLIDADKLFDFIQKEKAWKQDTYKQPRYGRGKYDAYYEMLDIIKEQFTIEAEPVVHGHWIETQNRNFETGKWIPTFVCSHCKRIIMLNEKENLKDFPYCHCGAKMDEEV